MESDTPARDPAPQPAPASGKGLIGQVIAHYEILEKLGEGGMGVVYKARDTHLDRFVAVKTLRGDALLDPERKLRFIQEAKSASALNHPNIIHIYDISNHQGIDYIAMEFVQGATLLQLIRRKRPGLSETLKYGIQIADALDAAHRAGIIHRDLKPPNVMVTDRGFVKILDFGLAKLAEPLEARDAELAITQTHRAPRTVAGEVLGTPAFMSPEQAAGAKVDARSDVFSLGLVLYQMVTGEMAYQGDSTGIVLAAILRDEPKPPRLLAPDLLPELEQIIMRCLRKEPARRFQTMADLKSALEDLREESAAGRLPSSPVSPVSVVVPSRPSRLPLALGAVALLLAVAAGAWWLLHRTTPAGVPSPIRLTSESGLNTDPAISPDGKLLAYASDRSGEGNLDIWVRQIGGREPIRLTRHQADDYQPNFSPDGTRIAFRSEREGGGIYLVATLGGEERRIADGGRRPRFSPDGKWIAYWVGPAGFDPTRAGWGKIFVVDSGGGPPRQVPLEFAAAKWPIWTPDGKSLLFLGAKTARANESPGWWVAPLEGGAAVQIAAPAGPEYPLQKWQPFAWREDRVIFTTREEERTTIQEVPVSLGSRQITGAPHRLTFGTTMEESPSVSSDGGLAFASVARNLDVYSLPINPNQAKITGTLQRLTRDLGDDMGPFASADGTKLVFNSNRSGQPAVWTKDLETSRETMLGSSPDPPILSADGSRVAWQDGKGAILVASFAGGPVERICEACGSPCGWSPDGKKILFTDYSKQSFVGVLDVASGQKIEYLRHLKYSLFPRSFSPDGRWIALSADIGEGRLALMIVPFHPGRALAEQDWITVTDGSARDTMPRWSPDGNTLYFSSARDGFMCVWAQRLHPLTKRLVGAPFPVSDFHGASLRMLASRGHISVARDKLLLSLEERTGSIWMLQMER